MEVNFIKIKDKLKELRKPARYLGNEFNVLIKDYKKCKVKVALAFPDLYEVGMSFLGFKILYYLLNREESICAERVFSPDLDMGDFLREENIDLFSLENKLSINSFDFVGFTLQYELSCTNILYMLELSKIPVFSKDRNESHPFVVGGGPCAMNPEPLRDFFDFFVIGDGEECFLSVLSIYENEYRILGREGFLKKISSIDGVFVPIVYDSEGVLENDQIDKKQVKRVYVKDLSETYYPEKILVPNIKIIHDRTAVEIMRGCSRGCRFCQAGMIYRPRRERSFEKIIECGMNQLKTSGYDEISFSSLSSTDHSEIEKIADYFMESNKPVAVSLPSMRIDQFSVSIAEKIHKGLRKTGFTFAPEAGSQRMRNIINKNISEEEILTAVSRVFQNGWKHVKLYFMFGLPFEEQFDLDEIIRLIESVVKMGHESHGRGFKINVSFSLFSPKAHTPFQWIGQISKKQADEKVEFFKNNLKNYKQVQFSFSNYETSQLEAIIARGDRRLGEVIYRAYKSGCIMDGWSEYFRYDLWKRAFEDCNLDMESLSTKSYSFEDSPPWEVIDPLIKKEFLINEFNKAKEEKPTLCCGTSNCTKCGVC